MDAPLGILFLKKAELYNLVERFDNQASKDKEGSENPNTWKVEKIIFEWTYRGHKHLGTPIVTDMFEKGSSKLRDWKLVDENGEIKKKYENILKKSKKIIENMVIKGFADPYLESDKGLSKSIKEGIIINREGLLVGEVIFKANEKPFIKKTYQVFSWLMDYGGAWVLLIVVSITLIMACINIILTLIITIATFWNVFG